MNSQNPLLYSAMVVMLTNAGCSKKNSERRVRTSETTTISKEPAPVKATLSILEIPSEEGTMLYEGTFSRDSIQSKFIKLRGRNGKDYILHDDGENGDKQADDGVYSIIIQHDKVTLQRFLQAENTIPF